MSPPSENSLGVTALLDELLSERDAAGEQIALRQQACECIEQQDATQEPALSAEDQRQLAELHQEVDGCLASLGNWEEESRLRREQLAKELEKEFGFSCDLDGDVDHVANSSALGCTGGLDDDEIDMSRYLGSQRRHHPGPFKRTYGLESEATAAHQPSSLGEFRSFEAQECEEVRRADAERIDNLRAEVEAMKQREMLGRSVYDTAHQHDLDATGGLSSGLSDWCAEVDAVLNDPSFGADLEGLTYAKHTLNEIDSGLDAAQSRVNDEILEMEKLLAECGAHIQAQKESLAT